MFKVRFVTITGREVTKLLKFVEVEAYIFELLCGVQAGGIDRFVVTKKRGCSDG